jgi:S-DNA-T family DNA segregation ATPase FtsK/SpoIIIE
MKKSLLPPLSLFKHQSGDKRQRELDAINGNLEPTVKLDFACLLPALERIRSEQKQLSTVLGLQGAEIVELDLYKLPFVLIGGMPGAGKSVCLDVMLSSLLVNYTPQQLKLYFIDFDEVTATKYIGFEHLGGKPIAKYDDAYNLFVKLKELMESRRNILLRKGKEKWDSEDGSFVLVVIDELTALLKTKSILKISDLLQETIERGRKYGIRLICATQKPSCRNVSTDIRDNFSATIALPVLNRQTSRMIIGEAGAERLTVGTCLARIGRPALAQCQIPYVTTEKVKDIARLIKSAG